MTLVAAYLIIIGIATLVTVATAVAGRYCNAPEKVVCTFLGAMVLIAFLWDLLANRYETLPKIIPSLFQPFI